MKRIQKKAYSLYEYVSLNDLTCCNRYQTNFHILIFKNAFEQDNEVIYMYIILLTVRQIIPL